MILYLLIIFFTDVVVSLVDIFLCNSFLNLNVWYIIGMVVLCTVVAFIIDLLVAILIKKLPEKWFNPNKKIYKIHKWERKFYELLCIKHWKEHIPELGGNAGFSKGKIERPNDVSYLYKFMVECCYGEIIHILGAILGFLIIFVCPIKYFVYFGLPIGIVNFILCILPLFVLRYNRKKIENIYKKKTNENKNQRT